MAQPKEWKRSGGIERRLEFSVFGEPEEPKEKRIVEKKVQKHDNPYRMLAENPELLYNIYQLSADSDMIYTEALVITNKTQVILFVFFMNRTGKTIESLKLELFTSNALKQLQQQKQLSIEKNGSSFQRYEFSIA